MLFLSSKYIFITFIIIICGYNAFMYGHKSKKKKNWMVDDAFKICPKI